MKNCLVCKRTKKTHKGLYCVRWNVIVEEPEKFMPCCDENISIEDLRKRIFNGRYPDE